MGFASSLWTMTVALVLLIYRCVDCDRGKLKAKKHFCKIIDITLNGAHNFVYSPALTYQSEERECSHCPI